MLFSYFLTRRYLENSRKSFLPCVRSRYGWRCIRVNENIVPGWKEEEEEGGNGRLVAHDRRARDTWTRAILVRWNTRCTVRDDACPSYRRRSVGAHGNTPAEIRTRADVRAIVENHPSSPAPRPRC